VHAMTTRVSREYVDDVSTLAGTHRNQPKRVRRQVIEYVAQLTTYFIQASAER
jgi:hypothetical protein